MRILVASSIVLGAFVLACGSSPPPADPSVQSSGAPAAGAEPAPATTKAADESSDGKCKSAEAPATAPSDLSTCLAGCEKLDDKVPEGSRCIPPRTSCKMHCNTQFKQ